MSQGFTAVLASKGLETAAPGLTRMRAALAELNLPWDAARTVLVGGTNGKGSAAFYLGEILRQSGARTLTFLSPHLRSPRERFLISGKPAPLSLLNAATAELSGTCSLLPQLTFFEFLCCLLPILRREVRPDWTVLEIGLGGTLDAVNAFPHAHAVLTGIGRDHVEVLGGSEEDRLRDKLGIVTPGVRTHLGPLSPPLFSLAAKIIQKHKGVLVSHFSQDEALDGITPPRLTHDYPPLVQAARLARAAAGDLLPTLPPVKLSRHLPGRCAWYVQDNRPGWWILDGAHNPEAAAAIGAYTRAKAGRGPVALGFALLARKEAPLVIRALAHALRPRRIVLPGPWLSGWLQQPAHDGKALAALFKTEGFMAVQAPTPEAFFDTLAAHEGPRLVTGGFHFLGAFLRFAGRYNAGDGGHPLQPIRPRPDPGGG